MLAEPEQLLLPLQSRRFAFTEVCVEPGQRVHPGQVLARDPSNFSVPLLVPRAGTVADDAPDGHLALVELSREESEVFDPKEDLPHVPQAVGSSGMKRYKLLELGAWQFFQDAHTGLLPNPFGAPSAVIISTLNQEPYEVRGDAQLHRRLVNFTRGLEHLQALVEYQPIYLVLPDIRSNFATQVRETIRGYAWVKLVQVPLQYPFDDFALLARGLGLKADAEQSVWGLRTEGVLAVDRALTLSRACDTRIVSLGGPGVKQPVHLRAMQGYPLDALLKDRLIDVEVRVIDGGVFRGSTVTDETKGLEAECTSLTVLPEQTEREFLGFVRPGFGRRSYSRCFLSAFRPPFRQTQTTGIRGEHRACIACGSCEEICPAGIMPHLIHKMLYQDNLDGAEAARIDLCVRCGLCSFVCPSKIELRQQFIEAAELIRRQLAMEEAEA